MSIWLCAKAFKGGHVSWDGHTWGEEKLKIVWRAAVLFFTASLSQTFQLSPAWSHFKVSHNLKNKNTPALNNSNMQRIAAMNSEQSINHVRGLTILPNNPKKTKKNIKANKVCVVFFRRRGRPLLIRRWGNLQNFRGILHFTPANCCNSVFVPLEIVKTLWNTCGYELVVDRWKFCKSLREELSFFKIY